MRQPDNLPAVCRVHRNGRPLMQIRIPRYGRARLACAGQPADLKETHAELRRARPIGC